MGDLESIDYCGAHHVARTRRVHHSWCVAGGIPISGMATAYFETFRSMGDDRHGFGCPMLGEQVRIDPIRSHFHNVSDRNRRGQQVLSLRVRWLKKNQAATGTNHLHRFQNDRGNAIDEESTTSG